MGEKILNELDELIKRKKHKEALQCIDNIDENSLCLQDRAYYKLLSGMLYMNLGSVKAEEYFSEAYKMYSIFATMGIAEPDIILAFIQCSLYFGILSFEYGLFDQADDYFDNVSSLGKKYERNFSYRETLISWKFRFKALMAKVKLLDKKGRHKVSAFILEDASELRERLEANDYMNDKLELFIIQREMFEHYSCMCEFDKAWIYENDLVQEAQELLIDDFQANCSEVSRLYIALSKAYQVIEKFDSAIAYAQLSAKVLNTLCYNEEYGSLHEEPLLARAYNCLGEAYMPDEGSYESGEEYLLKGYEIINKHFKENRQLNMEAFCENLKLLAEFYYINNIEGETIYKAVPYCLTATELYKNMFMERSESAYWLDYSASLLLMESIYSEIKESIADKAGDTAHSIMRRFIAADEADSLDDVFQEIDNKSE